MGMSIVYKTANVDFNFECGDLKAAFAAIAKVDAIFGHDVCGHCQGRNVKATFKEPQGYKYYSIVCQDCKHELKFGQKQEGGDLFVKNWDGENKCELPNGGWMPPYQGGNPEGRDSMKQNRETSPPIDSEDIPF